MNLRLIICLTNFSSKYPLALISSLMDSLEGRFLIGYDIGCGFSKTLNNSRQLGAKARRRGLRMCVGAFHAYAHRRPCQLDWRPSYVEGAGLEDFESCERFFSRSNGVAGCTRHASAYHRRQSIQRHIEVWNKDRYEENSTIIKIQSIQSY